MHRSWSIALVVASLAVACSDPDAPPSMDGVGTPLVNPPPRELHDPMLELYDGEGVPRESDERVAGLVLPRGLTPAAGVHDDRLHVYTSEVPPAKLLRYFGPRLLTMSVERRGPAAIYRQATPRGVTGGSVHLDVTIEPSSDHASRVEIYDRPPPPPEGTVISDEEIRRHFESQSQEAE